MEVGVVALEVGGVVDLEVGVEEVVLEDVVDLIDLGTSVCLYVCVLRQGCDCLCTVLLPLLLRQDRSRGRDRPY